MNGPHVNINGTSRAELIEQAEAVMLIAQSLIRVLGRAIPHGRDYQTRPVADYRADQLEWEHYGYCVSVIEQTYRAMAERLALEECK